MDKKKLLTASLASVAVLGAGFLASNPSVVKAAEDANAAATSTQPATEADATATAVTKEDVAEYFTDLEKQAEEAINKNDKITDKEAAILEAKAAIGKEDLLKAIDEKQITPEDVLKDLAEASKTESDEAEAEKYGKKYAPQDVEKTAAPGAELKLNESGEVTEVKPLNGGIDADAQDKINKRLDEEKTDVKDAEERLAAAKHDEKEAENNREEAKAAVESAKENVKAAQDELAAAKEAKAKFEKELASYADADGEQADQYREAARADLEKAEAALKEAEETLKQAEKEAEEAKAALEQADEDYYSYVADREAEEIRVLRRQIATDKAAGKDTKALEEELDIALNGVKPLVNEVNPYEGPVTGFFDETGENPIAEGELGTHAPKDIPGYTYTGISYTKDGILRHTYKATASNSGNSNSGHQANGGEYPGDRYIINRPSAPSTPAPATPATPATPAAPSTPAPGTDAPSAPTAETPATPAVAPTVAGTSQDNTYQAPAAKAEDKQELPNTGGKDNAAVAALGFFGLLLGALPFAKRKN